MKRVLTCTLAFLLCFPLMGYAAGKMIMIRVHVIDQDRVDINDAKVFLREITTMPSPPSARPENEVVEPSLSAAATGTAPASPPASGIKAAPPTKVGTSQTVTTRVIDVAASKGSGIYEVNVPESGQHDLFVKSEGYRSWSSAVVKQGLTAGDEYKAVLETEPLLEVTRTIIGFEQSGASASSGTQRFFLDMNTELPLTGFRSSIEKRKKRQALVPTDLEKATYSDLGPRLRTWGTVRITTVPQQINSSIGEFVSQFSQQALAVKVSDVAQAAEFLAGIELRLPWLREYAAATDETHLVSVSLLGGFGAITPLKPLATLQLFDIPPDPAALKAQFPTTDFSNKTKVAFISPDRDRFFRQYYAGFRFKTHYFEAGENTGRHHASLDVTYGVNESVTAGRLHGGVFRFDGFYALPIGKVRFLSLFGTALLKPSRAKITDPLVLNAISTSGVVIPSTDIAVVTTPQINRDFYRIGVGLNLLEVFAAKSKTKSNN